MSNSQTPIQTKSETMVTQIKNLKIKIFADGADVKAMLEQYRSGIVKGFTTNPTLMKKNGITDYEGFAKEALKNIPELRIITLGVFATNDIAMNMYKKFGFVEFGRLPEGVLHRGNYIDHIYMYKRVRD